MHSILWRKCVLVVTLLLLVTHVTGRIRGENGTLSLLIAVPLSKDNQTVLDPGWFHMASALLAVEHFNTRNASIVKELGELQDCSIQFGDVVAVDTGTNSHQAMEYVVEQLTKIGPVDAIAGPYHEIPALELSVLATGMKAPIVAHRSFDSNLLDPRRHPMYSQVNGDISSEMKFISNYLRHIGRDNYIAVLYSSTASEIQKVDTLKAVLDIAGFDQVRTFGYKIAGSEAMSSGSVLNALEGIKETGYRTIVALPSQLEVDAPIIGRHAMDLEFDQGGHFWLLSGGVAELTSMEIYDFVNRSTEMNATFLKGAAYAYTVDDKASLNFSDSILQRQSQPFFDRVQRLNPVSIDFGNEPANSIFPIQKIVEMSNSWMQGASYMFDAVLSIGIGACKATQNTDETAMTGMSHLEGIRAVEFYGASGLIKFGAPGSPGARALDTVPFAIANVIGQNGSLFVSTESFDPANKKWIYFSNFIYADGTTNPPVLRSTPNQNYLSPAFRAVGLSLMTIALIFIFLCALWVFLYRNHSVMIAAQPALLYTLCLGSTMMSLCVLLYSYDESYGWDSQMLDRMCVANVWLDALGHMVSLSALFTKLWRVNRCMRYNTGSIAVWRVMWPSVLLIGAVIVLLSIMTASGDHVWDRLVIDDVSGESIGRCVVTDSAYIIGPIYALHFIPSVLTGIMAYKTLGISDTYSESKWVLTFILVQVQVMLVGAPVIALLNDISTDARYLCYSLLIWTFPMSTMGLIILPKILTVRRMERNAKIDPPESNRQPESILSTEPARENSETQPGTSPNRNDGDEALSQLQLSNGPRMQIVTFD